MPLIRIQVRLLKHLPLLLLHHLLPIKVLLETKLLVALDLGLLRHLNQLNSLLHLLQLHAHLSQLSILPRYFLSIVDSVPLELLSFISKHNVLLSQGVHFLD